MHPRLRVLFALNQLAGVGPKTLGKVAAVTGIENASELELSQLDPRIRKACEISGAWKKALEDADSQIEIAQRDKVRIVSVEEQDFPPLLRKTVDRPYFIFVKGKPLASFHRSIAIIGTREPTPHGVITAERIATYFAKNEWVIVSGLALGCDAVAHSAALDCAVSTVAVLAHGLQTIAPKQHAALAERILSNGGSLVTEYGFGIEPRASQFVRRDRIQAGLCGGVVMIQSDVEGGSLHASRAAIEYGRVLGVPVATRRDVLAKESKIGANTVLTEGTTEQKAALLRCEVQDLARLRILHSREDLLPLERDLAAQHT